MILTRYLYDKAKVEETLYHAILQRDYQQSAFWAYELYFSGFEKEVVDQLHHIYHTRFEKNRPKLGIYIQKKQAELEGKPELIATIIKNLMKNPDVPEIPDVKFVNVKPHHIESFRTKEPEGPGWKFLREVCLYGVLGECSLEDLAKYRRDWVSCVSQTPIWMERMKDDGGEAFHNRWDYEPDEQPLLIQERCMGFKYAMV
jgi:hypothetical protein